MPQLKPLARRHPIVAYATLAYAFSWAAWGMQYLQPDPMGLVGTLLFVLGGLGPLVAGGAVAYLTGSIDGFRARLVRWRVPLRWYLVAGVGPFVVALTLVVVETAIDQGQFGAVELQSLVTLPGYLLSGLVLGGLEEPGWRGFAQSRLQRRFSALVASLVVAVLWVGWHLPLFLLPGTSQSTLPFGPFAVVGLALAIVFAWLFNSARQSVPVVMLGHGAYNGALGWSGLLDTAHVLGPFVLLTIGLWLVAFVVTVICGPETLAGTSTRSPTSEP